jgi:uncharacterized protein (TIGR03118 family)
METSARREGNMTRIFRHYRSRPFAVAVLVTMTLVLSVSRAAAAPLSFAQVNLVTDDKSIHPDAVLQDPSLVNAWGVSFTPAGSPFWVSDNGTGLATLYRVDPNTNAPTKQGLEVTIPGAGNPTGQVFNTNTLAGAFNQDPFLFVSEDGTVSGWRGALGTNAETLVLGSPDNVYKGAAFATVVGHSYLYAANFRAGTIDIVKGDAAAPGLAGTFTDPNLPSGFAPFNIRNLDGTLYVTYAQQDATKHDDVAGVGNGIVDAFDLNGNFLGRIGTQGTLNSPWGLEIAPASFGAFAGDLLVGNFGDGFINAFDLATDTFAGQLLAAGGGPLSIDGLWALTVGNGGNAGSTDKLYFTAGPDGEAHGLFGVLSGTRAWHGLAHQRAPAAAVMAWPPQPTQHGGLATNRYPNFPAVPLIAAAA